MDEMRLRRAASPDETAQRVADETLGTVSAFNISPRSRHIAPQLLLSLCRVRSPGVRPATVIKPSEMTLPYRP
jgi:hypothetical protein